MLQPEKFMELIRAFGADRILFGTDSPWSDQAQSLAYIRSLPLTEEEKEKILGGNAEKLLRRN
jgi:predicted TIM-barrel fold metal-dependent hydrolase